MKSTYVPLATDRPVACLVSCLDVISLYSCGILLVPVYWTVLQHPYLRNYDFYDLFEQLRRPDISEHHRADPSRCPGQPRLPKRPRHQRCSSSLSHLAARMSMARAHSCSGRRTPVDSTV